MPPDVEANPAINLILLTNRLGGRDCCLWREASCLPSGDFIWKVIIQQRFMKLLPARRRFGSTILNEGSKNMIDQSYSMSPRNLLLGMSIDGSA